MKKLLFLVLLVFGFASAQISRSYIDANDPIVNKAVDFYVSYIGQFNQDDAVDYAKYWSAESCAAFRNPDLAVFAISDTYPTYRLGVQTTIYYAKRIREHVLIKSVLSYRAEDSTNTVYAILDHYIKIPSGGETFKFTAPLVLNKSQYREKRFGNIDYHFPATTSFDKRKAKQLQTQLATILKAWGFMPVGISYYFTQSAEEMSAMRGFEYKYGDEQQTPSGISYPEDRLIFSTGSGEDNLHEVLHVYFNPMYVTSPVNHALIYYLAGGLGHDFQWFINRMDEYLQKYPETNLSQFDTIEPKDIMLHIDFTVLGIICKMVDEKEGVAGLKRLLGYETVDALFLKEFNLERKDWDAFVREKIKLYRK
ncbi:hypothetical protein [Flavobacterium silvaticum]|uniref:DUF4932 domain-containing protein n=1 Tax=Flavobacterium silvaticum TaxID=1852020 RepID=A0A972FL09_9FLAO|nr:hypothetical protein [Flavobacterium silvaticum]NMH27916.1 hypothetical protein [Flavobacterium silvaticum]